MTQKVRHERRKAFKTASVTESTLISLIQRKSIGHSLRKQGEQGAEDRRNAWRPAPVSPGPVNSGEVLPKGTTTLAPTAAATCMGPVSFVKTTRQKDISAQSSRNEVLPATLTRALTG